jgi:hypothetical protein
MNCNSAQGYKIFNLLIHFLNKLSELNQLHKSEISQACNKIVLLKVIFIQNLNESGAHEVQVDKNKI